MRILLTILVLLTLGQFMSCDMFNGCDQNNSLIPIFSDAKLWVPYKQGDEFLFGNDAHTDKVTVVTYLEKVESFSNGAKCPDGTKETIKVRITSKLFKDSIQFRVTDRWIVLLQNKNLELEFDESNRTLQGKDFLAAYHATLKIGSHNYTEALVSTCDTCDDLTAIVFAKNVGLVAFRTKSDYWFRN
jgi:hypothetical protein